MRNVDGKRKMICDFEILSALFSRFSFFSAFYFFLPPSFIQMTHLPFFDFILLMKWNERQATANATTISEDGDEGGIENEHTHTIERQHQPNESIWKSIEYRCRFAWLLVDRLCVNVWFGTHWYEFERIPKCHYIFIFHLSIYMCVWVCVWASGGAEECVDARLVCFGIRNNAIAWPLPVPSMLGWTFSCSLPIT